MRRIDPQDPRTALYAYLSGRTAACDVDNAALVYPFGCNASQKLAVQRALGNRVSVIEGPPGTGKTQTILNIVANLLMQGKTVGVVSNNNAAVDNVRDKLSKYEYGALMAELGNRTRRQAFFADKQQDFMPDAAWRLPAEERTAPANAAGRAVGGHRRAFPRRRGAGRPADETLLCPMRIPSSAVGTTAGRSADAARRPLFLPSDRQPACAVVPASRYREVAGRKAVARFAGRTAVPVWRVARKAAVRGCGAAARLCRSQVLRDLYRRAFGPHRPARGTVRQAACEEPDRSVREGVGSAVPRYALPQIRTAERSAAGGAAPVHDAELPDAFPRLRRTLSGRAEYDPFAVRFDRRGAPARLCHHRRVVAGRYPHGGRLLRLLPEYRHHRRQPAAATYRGGAARGRRPRSCATNIGCPTLTITCGRTSSPPSNGSSQSGCPSRCCANITAPSAHHRLLQPEILPERAAHHDRTEGRLSLYGPDDDRLENLLP